MRRIPAILVALVLILASSGPAGAAPSRPGPKNPPAQFTYPAPVNPDPAGAAATAAAAASSANCTIYIPKPTRDGTAIYGAAWQYCTFPVQQRMIIELRRWTGSLWTTLTGRDHGWHYSDWERVDTPPYSCYGKGTQTYALFVYGQFIDNTGGYSTGRFLQGESIKTTC